jgi:predicted DNA-binding transcriptional regulator YafY
VNALTARQARLLDALRSGRRVVTTSRVHEANRRLGAPKRTTARRDIAALHRAGLLIEGGADDARFYLLTRKARCS